ncbi:MAG: hypothetical protein GXO89_16105 [Chlorobi bacterium]|nr:hypothetical protein [Chlorobiota bacterium]
MNQTVNKIKRLEKFVTHKGTEDQVLDITINKILHREIIKLQAQIEIFDLELNQFEKKHNMGSMYFKKQFESGKLGDDMDFIEWISTIEMKKKAKEYISNLQGE